MNTITVRAILRIVAVLTMFAGGIGVCLGMLGVWSMRRFLQTHALGVDIDPSVAGQAELSWLVVSLSGLVLYVLSSAIARNIMNQPRATAVGLDLPEHGEIAPG
jgi:hypothetical protein